MSNTLEIVPGSLVTLHFSLALRNGVEAISTFDGEPFSFCMGDTTFQPGMELALYGLKAGDEQTITLTPAQAYGKHDPDLVQQMPVGDFNNKVKPALDQMISFALPNGGETIGVVRGIEHDQVTVDFNHPLAGHEVVFKASILDVAAPLIEEENP